MNICDVLKPEQIIPNLSGNSKMEVIDKLIDIFIGDERVADIEVVRKAVKEREEIMSTGVGNGFAIPHGKTNSVTDLIAAFGRCENPIDFEALDGEPVNLIFLLIGKENMVGPHIKMLSRISRMMNNTEFRANLVNSNSSAQIYELFKSEESKYFNQ